MSAESRRTVYLDNAATSFPKPACVVQAMSRFMIETCANPGRSAHRMSVDAARVIFDARELVAKLFKSNDPNRVVFTLNCTESINVAMKGLLRPGDHVVTSSMEHNSVMRPLRALEAAGVGLTVVQCSSVGELDPEDVRRAVKPSTKLVALAHASNVTGIVQPLKEVGLICHEAGALLLADCAQTAGSLPVDMLAEGIDLLAFSGHKSLFGPQGVGGLVIGDRVDAEGFVPLKQGGTGSASESERHPMFLPDMLEAGTPNTVGIAGLAAGIEFILNETVERIHTRETELISLLKKMMLDIPGVAVVAEKQRAGAPNMSFNIDGVQSSEASFMLDDEYGVLCRAGLQCAPAAHRTLGTYPDGAVRFSAGYFNTEEDIEQAARAVASIAACR